MADYPTIDTDKKSTTVPDAGIKPDNADDGTLRSRVMFGATIYTITLVHPGISAADKDSIIAHFNSEKGNTFTYTSPLGVSYSVEYLNEPQLTPHSVDQWTVVTRLRGPAV